MFTGWLTQWDRHGNGEAVCGGHCEVGRVTIGQVRGADDVMTQRSSRWQTEGRSQTSLSLTGLYLHTWRGRDRKQETTVELTDNIQVRSESCGRHSVFII